MSLYSANIDSRVCTKMSISVHKGVTFEVLAAFKKSLLEAEIALKGSGNGWENIVVYVDSERDELFAFPTNLVRE